MMESTRTDDQELQVLVAAGFTADHLQNILRLEKECFPPGWQYPAAAEDYTAALNDPGNVHVFLRVGRATIGYLLAAPFNAVLPELLEADPELREEVGKFYIETIQILPAHQGRGGARRLLERACAEGEKRGIVKFAIHARTANGFNEKIKRIFGDAISFSRKIEKWQWAGGEPYEYLEWVWLWVQPRKNTLDAKQHWKLFSKRVSCLIP